MKRAVAFLAALLAASACGDPLDDCPHYSEAMSAERAQECELYALRNGAEVLAERYRRAAARGARGVSRDENTRVEARKNSARRERQEAPDFEHVDLDGNPVRLSALRGKTVVIDFWATWCPPCVFQPSEFNAFLDRYATDNVVVLGIEVGGGDRGGDPGVGRGE